MEVKNFDKFVKVVTDNIIGKIDFMNDFKINEKSCLILIPNMSFGLKSYLDYILNIYPYHDMYLGSTEELSKIHSVENNKNVKFVPFDLKKSEFMNLIDAVETIIVLGLKVNQMKALLKSDDSEDINHIILGSLMANKTVNLMINANVLIYNKMKDLVNDVQNIGISVTNIQQCNECVREQVNHDELITEKYVETVKEKGLKVLVLNKKQIITPLAKDKLREYKIKIEYHKEENNGYK